MVSQQCLEIIFANIYHQVNEMVSQQCLEIIFANIYHQVNEMEGGRCPTPEDPVTLTARIGSCTGGPAPPLPLEEGGGWLVRPIFIAVN